MSKGWGARTTFGQKVILNVYDLSEINEHAHQFGVGVYHSGVEVNGREYTYGGGGGIFDHEPKGAPNCKFRESVEMGTFEGTPADIQRALDNLKSDFGPDMYNIINKNCNHFSDAFVRELLGRPVPGYVNRLAYLGSFFSCLIPPEYLGQAPTDSQPSASSSAGYQVFGGAGRASSAQVQSRPKPFAGSGMALSGAGSSSNVSADSNTLDRESMMRSRLARFENKGKQDS
mmetsp:Transcript_31436/g.40436  ORF Transcript_31436/g.40436 Transcript_31436/m.40436 type:complete len:230 (-) Transcript_31436:304-993(-)